ncbi:iron uptake porin [Alkalinema sp. FACHB-956]|uniref:iron uptake porin n=1 Tax=Alkalinema sp. FACHB-956 TaxID=2692768 RepID=UPI0016837E10|nr:iron uptake porin [Alkalinema sp. FACHB-956]MBD2328185.1 carbohydrate porin [Alkalinema sp. FACHB-956]
MIPILPAAPVITPPAEVRSVPIAATPSPLSAIASDALTSANPEASPEVNPALAQITAVSQLSDVKPTDWAFQALQSLVERYGCLAGYPERTFRGNRPLTRYEFAVGLNQCVDRLVEQTGPAIATGLSEPLSKPLSKPFVRTEDLATLKQLNQEFTSELATLRGSIASLEQRTASLEQQQFSTTVKLQGQAVFGLGVAAGGKPPGKGENNVVLTDLIQLQLASSFRPGRDLLRVGLVASNFANDGFGGFQALNTNMAFTSYLGNNNQLQINTVDYRFAVNDRLVLAFQPVGFTLSSVLSTNSSYGDAGTGAISRFAALNPVLRMGNLDAGVGLDWLMSNRWRLQVAYGARSANDPQQGLFGSGHQAIGVQLLNKPSANTILGFTYINAYASDAHLDTFTGSQNADTSGGIEAPAKMHALAASMRWRVSPKVTLGAWGGAVLTDSTFGRIFRVITDRDVRLKDLGAVTLATTYLVSLGIEDPFGRIGDQWVFMVGQPPKLNAGVLIERSDSSTSLHFETFYRMRINDHLSIVPGFFWVTNPGHIRENNDIFVGSLRTTFNF